MAPDQFAEAWGDDTDHLVRFPLRLLTQFPLRFADMHFLAEAGLPSAAAPFLSFGPQYAEVGSFAGAVPEGLLQIGSNGSGDPIVLNADGQVHYLNHDANLAPRYINRDLPTLAEALLRYRSLIEDTIRIAGPDAFVDGSVPLRKRDTWIEFLKSADPAALATGALWAEEMSMWASE